MKISESLHGGNKWKRGVGGKTAQQQKQQTNKQPLSNRTQNARHLQMQTLSCESKTVADKTGPAITIPNSRKRSLNGALRSGPDAVVLLSMMRQESDFWKEETRKRSFLKFGHALVCWECGSTETILLGWLFFSWRIILSGDLANLWEGSNGPHCYTGSQEPETWISFSQSKALYPYSRLFFPPQLKTS